MKVTQTVSNQKIGRTIHRIRNGAIGKGNPFCDKGVEFSFGFTAFMVLGVRA